MILKYWFILIFAPPGNGKSLEQARISEKLFQEYKKTEKKYPELKSRILVTNQILNFDNFKIKNFDIIKHHKFFIDPKELRYCFRPDCWKVPLPNGERHILHDVDILIDEGSTMFPADGWDKTPFWLRKMWAQHRHNGIRIVMLTQDYMAIDINCRRMLWQSYHMKKYMGSRDISPTLPALSKWTILNFLNPKKRVVWGVYGRRRFDPLVMKMDTMNVLTIDLDEKIKKEFNPGYKHPLKTLKLVGGSEWHLITWHKINLFDTTQNVKEWKPEPELEHVLAVCKVCGKEHLSHYVK